MKRSGFTLVEFMIAMLIVLALASIALANYQRYMVRAKAAGVAVEAGPIKRAIDEVYARVDRTRSYLQLVNATDGSILGCAAPIGSSCSAAGLPLELVVPADKLLLAENTIRVSAAPCYVDCPSFALNFSSNVTIVGNEPPPAPPSTPPAAPPAPPPPAEPPPVAPPASPPAAPPDQSPPPGGGKDSGKGEGKGGGKGQTNSTLFHFVGVLVPSAHAAATIQQTNRVLYEFGEIMRSRVHASDNAACLFSTGTCTVTIKF
jgi:prepilin-type N-terminal cleavage/methylation domain-containing protein